MLYSRIRLSDGEERQVARVIMGTTQFGTRLDRDQVFRLLDQYWQAGGNAIDTARVYGSWIPGHEDDSPSERAVGEWIRSRGVEKEVFLITKGGHPPLRDMKHGRLGRQDVFHDLEKSMDALGVGKIDLYYLHRDDTSLPAEEIMDTLFEAQKTFPVKALGASNWRAKRIQEANRYADTKGKAGFAASEIRWSYVDYSQAHDDPTLVTMDQAEYEQYKNMDLAVMAYSSQGNGLFQKGFKADLSDASERYRAMVTPENIRRYQALLDRCQRTGATPDQVVIRYIVDNPDIRAFSLVGCSNVEQLARSLDAVKA